jgi:outer membrane lipoprotein SlyB
MEAGTYSQTGSTRISSLVLATVASGTVAGLVVLGALTGVLPTRGSGIRNEEPSTRVESHAAVPAVCALCGTIESVRVIEIYEESTTAAAAIEPRSGEAASGGPGAAIASGAASVLDTLNNTMRGNEPENNVRKRHVYRVTLRMDDGSFRAISSSSPPAFSVGDKVRVVEGRLVRS